MIQPTPWSGPQEDCWLERYGMRVHITKVWDDWWMFRIYAHAGVPYDHANRRSDIHLNTFDQARVAAECCVEMLKMQADAAAERRADVVLMAPQELRHVA